MAKDQADPTVEALPSETTLRQVMPSLADKTWFITRADSAGLDMAQRTLDKIWRGDAGGELGDLTARDPRGIGIRGGYPQINEGLPNQGAALRLFVRYAYRRSAAARALVDTISGMVFGEWIEVQSEDEALKTAIESVYRSPTGRPGDKPLYWWMERAYRLARRDSRAILYFGLDDSNAKKPSEPAKNVKGILGLTIIRDENIVQAIRGNDPQDKATFNRILGWKVTTNQASSLGPAGTTLDIHADRCIPFIPLPSEEDDSTGESVLALNINYVEMMENLLWSSSEAYFTEASPYLVVSLDKDVKLTEPEKLDAKKQIGQLQQSSTQRIFLRGVTVTVLQGSGTLANPIPHWEIGMQALALAMGGFPVSMLVGNQAGKLSGAQEDSSRVQSLISKLQETDADPALQTLNARLIEWGVKTWGKKEADKLSFSWNPLFEPSPIDFASSQLSLANARVAYKQNGLPLPEEMAYDPAEGGWPEGTEDDEEKLAAPQPEAKSAPEEKPIPDAEKGDTARLVNHHIEALTKRAERRIRAALKPIYDRAAASVDGVKRSDSAADVASQAISSQASIAALAAAIEELYVQGLEAGADSALQDLDIDRTYRALQSTSIKELRTLSKTIAADSAARLAEQVRKDLAEGISKGESPSALARRVEGRFKAIRVDANRIARTEAMRAFNRGGQDAMKEAGVREKRFVAYPDADSGDVDGVCQQLDGKVVPLGDDSIDPPDHTHPNCRCYMAPVLP